MFKTKNGREINYYGSEFNDEIKGIKEIKTLNEMFTILLNCWSKETAYPASAQDESYNITNDPTYGQCAITSYIVNDYFGGTIHKIKVNGGTHYFNKINGKYIDMTADQFSLYDIKINYKPNMEIKREFCGKNPNTLKRYNILNDNIQKYLNSKKVSYDSK